MKFPLATVLVVAAALVSASVASAHAHVSPPIVVKGESQVFTLAVPTEKENAETTKVELTPPDGFSIDSFSSGPPMKTTKLFRPFCDWVRFWMSATRLAALAGSPLMKAATTGAAPYAHR